MTYRDGDRDRGGDSVDEKRAGRFVARHWATLASAVVYLLTLAFHIGTTSKELTIMRDQVRVFGQDGSGAFKDLKRDYEATKADLARAIATHDRDTARLEAENKELRAEQKRVSETIVRIETNVQFIVDWVRSQQLLKAEMLKAENKEKPHP